MENLGIIIAIAGAVFAAFMSGMGSAKGVGMVGEAAAGVLSEDPTKFSKLLILQLLPGTQGIYGFLTAFIMLLNVGVIGGSPDISVVKGILYFAACTPIALVGYQSALKQARVAVSGVAMVAKQPEHNTKAMTMAAMVETYAVLALLVSLLAITGVAGLDI